LSCLLTCSHNQRPSSSNHISLFTGKLPHINIAIET
jgi:hypothetical protein